MHMSMVTYPLCLYSLIFIKNRRAVSIPNAMMPLYKVYYMVVMSLLQVDMPDTPSLSTKGKGLMRASQPCHVNIIIII